MREFHPARPAQLKLADAQLVVARRYGFPSWPAARAPRVVERYAPLAAQRRRGATTPADEFLRLACLTTQRRPGALAAGRRAARRDARSAARPASSRPRAGDVEAARAATPARRGAAAAREGGPHRWEPLLYVAYSRVRRGRAATLEVARLLLDHGADPNAGYLWEGLPSPFTALTGAFGRGEGDPPPHAHEEALATLLLEAGADPNDAQTIYNCSGPRTTRASSCCCGTASAAATAARGTRGSGPPTRRRRSSPRTR